MVGLGRSGIGAARLLNAQGTRVIIQEQYKNKKLEQLASDLEKEGIIVHLDHSLEISNFDKYGEDIKAVVISPGIPWNHPTLNQLRKQSIPIYGEINLAWKNLKDLPWIGITGTNGKTTVTYLLNHLLETNGKQAPMGGNVGNSASELALKLIQRKINKPDWIVMELSSYQIEASPEIKPRIGIWTNLTADHLDRHGTLDAYRKIKRSLLDRSEIRIFNGDDPDLTNHKAILKKGIWISTKNHEKFTNHSFEFWIDQEGTVMEKNKKLFESSVLKMPGEHNLQNLLLATAAARQVGLSPKSIANSFKTFTGIPHRLEELGEIKNIKVFNDSKATNYIAATMGLKALSGKIVVLAGGQTKEGNATEWLEQLHKSACGIVLFGLGAKELNKLIKTSGFLGRVESCKELDKAVKLAVLIAHNLKAKNILLSPACASFDQYSNFEERGEHFRKLIKPLLNK